MDGRSYLLALFVFLTGCTARDAVQNVGREAPEQFAKLTRLKQSHNAELREELERVEADGGLPLQLECLLHLHQEELAGLVPADRLPRLLSTADAHLRRFVPTTEDVLSHDDDQKPAMNEANAEVSLSLQAFLHEHAVLRTKITAAFAGERLPVFHVPCTEGPLADLSFVGICRLGHCLLALETTEHLSANRPGEAAANVRTMLRIAQALAATPHATPRLAAVEIRAQALSLLAHVARNPATSPESLEQVRTALDDALAHWPDDALAWRGDRASTLVTYELVAQGKLLTVLDGDDLIWLRKHDRLAPLVASVNSNWDYDAAFYLSAQREILAACNEPYYVRREVFERLDGQLKQLESTARFPRLAAELFLADLERGHRLQALDWARCEAWSLAFSLAGTSAPLSAVSAPINPVTGQPFLIEGDAKQIVVRGVEAGDHDEIACVPLPPLAPVAERPIWKR